MTTEQKKEVLQEAPASTLSSSILHRIENEHVAPLPKWQFLVTEYGVWVLWGLSVFFGGVAFSVMMFFLTHAGFAFYEATHETLFDLIFEILPLVWIVVFALMALLAHYNLRHTKKGYKYTVFRVLVSSVLVSFVGGILLHVLGAGFFIDAFIAKQAPFLPTLERIETRMWQKPDQGRMIGVYRGKGQSDGSVLVTDTEGAFWEVSTTELGPLDLDLLYTGKRVHIMGILSSTTESSFHGCAVLPWRLDEQTSIALLRRDRDMFLEKMEQHHKNMLREFIATGTIPESHRRPLCGTHSAVLRITQERNAMEDR